jgi:DNA polymerase-3 subunit epsilon
VPTLQLALDAADRLAERLDTVGVLPVREAAALLVAASAVPDALARSLVDEVLRADARFRWRSAGHVTLARASSPPLECACFCVFDLETTGMRPTADRIVEIGAVRVVALEPVGCFERLVDPGVPIPHAIERLTGLSAASVRGRGHLGPALDAFLRFAGDAALVAHNARFDVGFLDASLRRLRGHRNAAPVIDTVALARALLPARRGRFSLAALADRFDTGVTPCHRALPDAQATAELLLALIGLAQQRGATTVADLVRLSLPPARRAHEKRALADAAPRAPGTYVMRAADGRALYVGTAGDLRRRTVSYFRGGRQPHGVERALADVERLDFGETGSAFEARLDEIRLILDLRPTANRRGVRPEKAAFLRIGGAVARLTTTMSPSTNGAAVVGPLGSRREVERVAAALRLAYGLRSCRPARPLEGNCLEGRLGRCLAPCRGGEHAAAHERAADAARQAVADGGRVPVERLRARRAALVASLRFEEAAGVRDLEAALRRAGATLTALRAARRRHGVVLAAHRDPRLVAAFTVVAGLVVERRGLPRVGAAELEISSLLATLAREAAPAAEGAVVEAERREELLHVDATFQRPPAGVAVVAVDPAVLPAGAGAAADRIAAARARIPAALPPAARPAAPTAPPREREGGDQLSLVPAAPARARSGSVAAAAGGRVP